MLGEHAARRLLGEHAARLVRASSASSRTTGRSRARILLGKFLDGAGAEPSRQLQESRQSPPLALLFLVAVPQLVEDVAILADARP